MAAYTFNWAPDNGAECEYKPRILSGQFGDGYEQRVADGINHNPESHSLTWSAQTLAERNAIVDFLKARGGVEAFNWTPPAGVAGTYVCKEWSASPTTAIAHRVTATFTQVFE